MTTLLVLSLAIATATSSDPNDWRGVICYAPTNFNPNMGKYPSAESITADLQTISEGGVRGICTYASDGTLALIPSIARALGFEWVIMGIWCPADDAEVEAAIAQADHVDGYCINNEGLPNGYSYCPFDTAVVASAMAYVRAETGKPVTTAEQIDDYLADDPLAAWLLGHGDWLFPNCHPYWAGITDSTAAASYVVAKYEALAAATEKRIIIKETGQPSGGCASCSEENQLGFWRELAPSKVPTFLFEAFDGYWKDWDPVESHWGFYDQNRNPKLVALWYERFTSGVPVARSSWGRIKSSSR